MFVADPEHSRVGFQCLAVLPAYVHRLVGLAPRVRLQTSQTPGSNQLNNLSFGSGSSYPGAEQAQ